MLLPLTILATHGVYTLRRGAANALATVILSDDDHRNVAVCHSIGKRAQEAKHLAIIDCYQRPLRSRYERTKLLRVRDAMRPAGRRFS